MNVPARDEFATAGVPDALPWFVPQMTMTRELLAGAVLIAPGQAFPMVADDAATTASVTSQTNIAPSRAPVLDAAAACWVPVKLSLCRTVTTQGVAVTSVVPDAVV